MKTMHAGERAAIAIANTHERMYGVRPLAVEFDELWEEVKQAIEDAERDVRAEFRKG